jgi:ATP-dependent Clp protease ATP-binding subunit ClpC
MYERFTDRVRKVMQYANDAAQRCGHEYTGTEHLLLGLASEGSGVAARVLQSLGVDREAIRRKIALINAAGPGGKSVRGRRSQTPRARRAIEFAIDEARQFGHKHVGTEHLLLGLLQEEESVAAVVLANRGLRLEDVRLEVLSQFRDSE